MLHTRPSIYNCPFNPKLRKLQHFKVPPLLLSTQIPKLENLVAYFFYCALYIHDSLTHFYNKMQHLTPSGNRLNRLNTRTCNADTENKRLEENKRLGPDTLPNQHCMTRSSAVALIADRTACIRFSGAANGLGAWGPGWIGLSRV